MKLSPPKELRHLPSLFQYALMFLYVREYETRLTRMHVHRHIHTPPTTGILPM